MFKQLSLAHFVSGPRDTGQALIIFVFLLTGLVGMMGLAIDGGQMFLTQRDAQNAVDAAILASARSLCVDDDIINSTDPTIWQTKGFNAATANGFVNGVDDTTVSITHPTQAFLDTNGAPGEPEEYTVVSITRTIESFFIQIVYSGPLTVTVEGIARCNPGEDMSFFDDKALVACNQNCQGGNPGIKVNGNGTTTILDGGTFSNCLDAGYKDAGGAGGNLTADGANEGVSEGACYAGSDITPTPTCDANDLITCPLLPEPTVPTTCQGYYYLYDTENPTGGNLIEEGVLNESDSIPAKKNRRVELDPGCYGGMKVTGGSVKLRGTETPGYSNGEYIFTGDVDFAGKGSLEGEGVFLFLAGSASDILKVTGQGSFTWTSPSSGDYAGLAILHQNCGDIAIAGKGATAFSGTIYAPCSDIDLGGNGAGNYIISGQIIGGTSSAGGNGSLTLRYGQPFDFPSTPPNITIVQ